MWFLQLISIGLLLNCYDAADFPPPPKLPTKLPKPTTTTLRPPIFKIIGGEYVGIDIKETYPFMASIQLFEGQYCGGSILNERFIITSADCIEALTPDYLENLSVVVGTNSLKEGGISYYPQDFFIPEFYDKDKILYDIGLILIKDKIQFNEKVQPIQLETKFIDVNTPAVVIGWGADTPNGNPLTDLKSLNVVTTFENCEFRSLDIDPKIHLGAYKKYQKGKEKPYGACFGDGGGPLVANNKLIAVFSFMSNPCAKGLCDVFTRVSPLIGWIEETMQKYL